MGILAQKKLLITGLISDRSIAYGVAEACFKQGAQLAFTYQHHKHEDRVKELASHFNSDLVLPMDVSVDAEIRECFSQLTQYWNGLDGVLHSIAFVPKIGLSGDFVNNIDRNAFAIGADISAYSFIALAKEARLLLKKNQGSLVCLSYLGSNKVVPNYNMAGVAKAALEASARYMAAALGEDGIRVNTISAGPIKTLASSGISGFSKILDCVAAAAPLKRNIKAIEVGNVAAFLFSELASAITGEVIFVDAGFNIMAAV